jgi:hypothetical protein
MRPNRRHRICERLRQELHTLEISQDCLDCLQQIMDQIQGIVGEDGCRRWNPCLEGMVIQLISGDADPDDTYWPTDDDDDTEIN